jgi:hypothetical protein
MARWDPPVELTAQEERLLKRLHRERPLFGFLRRHRHELWWQMVLDCLGATTPPFSQGGLPGIKAGLDIDWSDPKQKAAAVE